MKREATPIGWIVPPRGSMLRQLAEARVVTRAALRPLVARLDQDRIAILAVASAVLAIASQLGGPGR